MHVLLSTELFIQHFKIYKIAHIHLQVVLTNYEDEQHLRRSQERMRQRFVGPEACSEILY